MKSGSFPESWGLSVNVHPSQGTDTQDVKAPHEEGSGGYKVIRKGSFLEERFEVDFEGWEGDCFRRQKSRFLLWRNGDGKLGVCGG